MARILVTLSVLALCIATLGCGGPKKIPESQAKQLQDELLDLEWKMSQKWGSAHAIATAPVIPGRVDVVPSSDPFSDRYNIVRGATLYVPDGNEKLAALHKDIDVMSKRYQAIEKQLRDAGCSVPTLAKCQGCNGCSLAYGPHYELGRREDGSLGMVFVMSGLHCCTSCGGAGVQKPGTN